jgi:hypothetical protein
MALSLSGARSPPTPAKPESQVALTETRPNTYLGDPIHECCLPVWGTQKVSQL